MSVSMILVLTMLFQTSAFASAAYEDQATASSQANQGLYQTYSQGVEEYGVIEESYDSWYASLPYYQGEKIYSKEISKELKELEKTLKKANKTITITEDDSQSVATIYKTKLNKSKDQRFKTWKNSDLTIPVSIYSFDESTYGYMYGIVDKNDKLVGYIVAGASLNAPPILEYSLYPDKYISLSNCEKLYFGSETGFVFAKDGKLFSAYDNAQLTNDIIEELVDARSQEDLVEIKDQWVSISQMASAETPDESVPTVEPSYPSGTQYRLEMDTSDHTWYNVCSYTSMAMYFDALGRRIEPGFLQPGRPHSTKINDYLHNTYGHLPTFDDCADILLSYANSKKLTSSLTFTKHYVQPLEVAVLLTLLYLISTNN